MTPAEREALPPLDIPQGVHGYPFCDCDIDLADDTCKIQPPYMSPIEYARKVIEQRERQLLAKMSLISSLELTLSNSTNVNVLQMERVEKLEELLRRYRYFGQSMCSNPDCDVLTCIEKKSMEREFTKLMLLAAPTEPTPEESR